MFFGEMSALTGEPRSALVVAATDALVFEITKTQIAALIRNRPELAEKIAEVVTERKLRNSQAVAKASLSTTMVKKKSLTAQLMSKMLSFFGLKAEPATKRIGNAEGNLSLSTETA